MHLQAAERPSSRRKRKRRKKNSPQFQRGHAPLTTPIAVARFPPHTTRDKSKTHPRHVTTLPPSSLAVRRSVSPLATARRPPTPPLSMSHWTAWTYLPSARLRHAQSQRSAPQIFRFGPMSLRLSQSASHLHSIFVILLKHRPRFTHPPMLSRVRLDAVLVSIPHFRANFTLSPTVLATHVLPFRLPPPFPPPKTRPVLLQSFPVSEASSTIHPTPPMSILN